MDILALDEVASDHMSCVGALLCSTQCVLVTSRGNLLIGERQVPVWKAMLWQEGMSREVMSREVMDWNPRAGEFFS